MKKEAILFTKSLKEQVYEYLRDEIHKQNIRPGAVLNMDATSRKLGISKTPLRDALIQMEMEGFVTISPRRGIFVNVLTIDDVKEFYQVIGALEHSALITGFPNIKPAHVAKMHKAILDMRKALEADNFDRFYEKNLLFHNTYIDSCRNSTLSKIVTNLKKRLYDFPPQQKWIKEWEEASTLEHEKIVRLIEEGNAREAADYIRDVHWSYTVQERFITRYYSND